MNVYTEMFDTKENYKPDLFDSKKENLNEEEDDEENQEDVAVKEVLNKKLN